MSNHPCRRRGLRNRALAACAAVAVMVASAPPAVAAEPVSQRQWFLAAVKARNAHKITKGAGVIVAVIGSGVDAGHPDLAGAVLPGIGGSANRTGRTDPDGAGTRAAGIIAARGGGDQALGIAPRSRILPVAVGTPTVSLAQPIRWAVDHGAKVVSITVPGPRVPADEAAAIAYALAKDVVVVTGADRAGGEPVRIPGVVAVSGITRAGTVWTGSARGPQVALAAPAEAVLSTTARQADADGYSTATSAANATAIVSGVAALIRARFPRMRAADVANRLMRTAADRGPAGRDDLYGSGVVDAERALTAQVPAFQATPAAPAPSPTVAAPPDGGTNGVNGLLDTPWGRFGLVLAIGAVLLSVLAGGVLLAARASARRSPPWPPAPQVQHQAGPVAGRPPTGPAGDW